MGESDDPKSLHPERDRRELLARLRNPKLEDTTLPTKADRHLRLNPDNTEVREARARLPELDQSE